MTFDVDRSGRPPGSVDDEHDVVDRRLRDDLARRGVVFCAMPTARREYPDLVGRYSGTVIAQGADRFDASDPQEPTEGWFVYVPPGVECEVPLQVSSRTDSERADRFARTLIVADEGSTVHYIEGCSAPVYTTDSHRSVVVEIVVEPSARVTCTTIQNWSSNVDLVATKRARVGTEGHMRWIDVNIGSRLTRSRPSVYLVGAKARGEALGVSSAGARQHQDTGAEMVHLASETSSEIVSRSVAKDGGMTTFRSLVRVEEGATGCASEVRCDALTLDDASEHRMLPCLEIGERDARIGHEVTVAPIPASQLFYAMSRGLSREQAMGMIVNGFFDPVVRTLPMEYAVEWSRLVELQMEGSVG